MVNFLNAVSISSENVIPCSLDFALRPAKVLSVWIRWSLSPSAEKIEHYEPTVANSGETMVNVYTGAMQVAVIFHIFLCKNSASLRSPDVNSSYDSNSIGFWLGIFDIDGSIGIDIWDGGNVNTTLWSNDRHKTRGMSSSRCSDWLLGKSQGY